jgi:hypothetical protein
VQDSGQFTPAIVSDSTISGAIIVWRDQRTRASTSSDVYAQRVGDTLLVGVGETRGKMIEARLEVWPNPFHSKTTVKFEILNSKFETNSKLQNSKSQTLIKIYDITGTLIRSFSLPDVCLSVPNSIIWDGTGEAGEMLGNGIYFCILEAGDKNFATKIIFAK